MEFALILPIMLIIIMGILNFGYLFGQKLDLNQAARDGARQSVVPGNNNGADVDTYGEIQGMVRASVGGLVTAGQVDVKVDNVAVTAGNSGSNGGCKTSDVGEPLTVEATYQAHNLVPWFLPGLPNTYSLTSKAVFRCEW